MLQRLKFTLFEFEAEKCGKKKGDSIYSCRESWKAVELSVHFPVLYQLDLDHYYFTAALLKSHRHEEVVQHVWHENGHMLSVIVLILLCLIHIAVNHKKANSKITILCLKDRDT